MYFIQFLDFVDHFLCVGVALGGLFFRAYWTTLGGPFGTLGGTFSPQGPSKCEKMRFFDLERKTSAFLASRCKNAYFGPRAEKMLFQYQKKMLIKSIVLKK